MTDKKKQVEELAKTIYSSFRSEPMSRALASMLVGEGYCKSTELAKEIFGEIEFEIHQLDFDREETRAIAIEGIIANAKKKYTQN